MSFFSSCKVCLFSGGKAGILEENGVTYEDLVQPDVIVMQYSFEPFQGSQVPQSFQEVTSEFRYNVCVARFCSSKRF
jgi:hypothetical protein